MKFRVIIDVDETEAVIWQQKVLPKLMGARTAKITTGWIDETKNKPTITAANGVVPYQDDTVPAARAPRHREPTPVPTEPVLPRKKRPPPAHAFKPKHPDGPAKDRLLKFLREELGQPTFTINDAEEAMELLDYDRTSTWAVINKLVQERHVVKVGKDGKADVYKIYVQVGP